MELFDQGGGGAHAAQAAAAAAKERTNETLIAVTPMKNNRFADMLTKEIGTSFFIGANDEVVGQMMMDLAIMARRIFPVYKTTVIDLETGKESEIWTNDVYSYWQTAYMTWLLQKGSVSGNRSKNVKSEYQYGEHKMTSEERTAGGKQPPQR